MSVPDQQSAAPQEKSRWFCPSPGWIVVVSLATTGLLFLSERYRWFAFNQHKGWTVLIALASVGVGLLAMLLWWIAALLFRWRVQFGIRSLLVLTLAVALQCVWISIEVKKASQQRKAVEEIERVGGSVHYGWQIWVNRAGVPTPIDRPPPAWLGKLLEDDFFGRVMNVQLNDTQVTNDGLKNLRALSGLKGLRLNNTQITDAGLENLRESTALRYLDLADTKVTDAGLENFRELTELLDLVLKNTQVTDAGVKKLQQALPDCNIER